MRQVCKYLTLFVIGGVLYACIEMIWRGHTHWTMAVLGGICFIICGCINEFLSWDTPLLLQCLICAVLITIAELIAGLILNIKLGLAIWDYSGLPFNFMGQICLEYSCLWYLLSLVAILLDDWIRWKFFGEEKPRYKIV